MAEPLSIVSGSWLAPLTVVVISFVDPLVSSILAIGFAAAYLHVGTPSRRRARGWLARFVLASGPFFLLLDGLYELSVDREFKPENVPIRVDLLLIWPALFIFLVLGALACIYGLAPPKETSTADVAPTAPSIPAAGLSGPVRPKQANERLAHLLSKPKNEQQN